MDDDDGHNDMMTMTTLLMKAAATTSVHCTPTHDSTTHIEHLLKAHHGDVSFIDANLRQVLNA